MHLKTFPSQKLVVGMNSFFIAWCSTVLQVAADIAVEREEKKMQLTVNSLIKNGKIL